MRKMLHLLERYFLSPSFTFLQKVPPCFLSSNALSPFKAQRERERRGGGFALSLRWVAKCGGLHIFVNLLWEMLFFPNVSTKWYEWYNVKHKFVILSGARNCWPFVKLVAPAININFFTQFFAHFFRALVATNHPHPRLVALAARGGREIPCARVWLSMRQEGRTGVEERGGKGGWRTTVSPELEEEEEDRSICEALEHKGGGGKCLFVSLLYSLLKKLSKMEQ